MREKYWLACMVNLIGIRRIHVLLGECKNAEAIAELNEEQLMEIAEIPIQLARRMVEARMNTDWKNEQEKMNRKKMRFITIEETEYPRSLRTLPDPPYGLFVKGELPDEGQKLIAIVGARQCSEYGREVAGRLAEILAECGVGVVSGMAKGIDSAGHFGCLRRNGRTYAVLGCGADVCYPAGNRLLYEKMIQNGGIVSEYPPDTQPLPKNFPLRNRIISGLCDVLVVVEAKERSGSLITADAALEQGKDVYAVPGRLDDLLSAGCNRLIKQGAGIIVSPEEFVRELGILKCKKDVHKNFLKNSLEKEEMLLYSVLSLQPRNINEIINATGLDVTACIRLLSSLEAKGYIRETFQNYYIRILKE